MSFAPIALFVYNRPQHTKRTVEALLKNPLASKSNIYIYSDGPKNELTAAEVADVRKYLATIHGFASVHIVERDGNQGLARSIIDGVSTLCGEYGRVIVIEDDLVVSKYFLEYMNSALTYFEKNDRVMQISGYMFPVDVCSEADALFLPFISSWGWATWKRAWDHFDEGANGFDELKSSRELRKSFDLNNSYSYFRMLELQQDGKINSWAIRWYLSVFFKNGVVLYPKSSLVQNIGFDGSGTHCEALDFMSNEVLARGKIDKFPNEITVNEMQSKVVYRYLRNQNDSNLFLRLLRKASRCVGFAK